MNTRPDQQATRTQTRQPADDTLHRATQIAAAVDAVYDKPTSHHNPDLPCWQDGPAIGDTPPVPQPGRPAMSSKATDDSVRMISAGFLTLCAGGATAAVLRYSSDADPTVIGLIAAAPLGIAVPILALSRLMRRATQAAEAAPPVHHHHYNGTVTQEHHSVHVQHQNRLGGRSTSSH